MNDLNKLLNKHCVPCKPGTSSLSQDVTNTLIKQLKNWMVSGQLIERTFEFKNYYQTMAFVNAVAWISHQEDHHPYLNVSYNKCHIQYFTHSIDGLSENDFICAAKVNALIANKNI